LDEKVHGQLPGVAYVCDDVPSASTDALLTEIRESVDGAVTCVLTLYAVALLPLNAVTATRRYLPTSPVCGRYTAVVLPRPAALAHDPMPDAETCHW